MHKVQLPNPALKQFSRLVGEWKVVGTHGLLPNTIFHGRFCFQWIESGAFLLMRSEMEDDTVPDGTAVFGSDDATGEFFMLYFDERKVSRKYDVSFQYNLLKWWRNAPGFSQRYTWTFTDNDDTIISKGQLSKNGTTWEKDLELTFTRIK